jgi:hypothetical protein
VCAGNTDGSASLNDTTSINNDHEPSKAEHHEFFKTLASRYHAEPSEMDMNLYLAMSDAKCIEN